MHVMCIAEAEVHYPRRDVELRFKGNKDCEEEELALTLSEFYSKYTNRPDRDAFIPTSKVKGHAKGNYLEMELHVFMDRVRTIFSTLVYLSSPQ